MEQYTASVVGCGAGGTLSIDAYAASPHYRLAAVCDLRDEALAAVKARYPDVATFRTHGEMFHSAPTDVVSVSTFPPTHLPITLEALDLPLTGILVEKPLGDTAEAGRRIIAAVKERGIPLVVPHSWLARDISAEIVRTIASGAIGRLHLMEVQCRKWDIISAGIHWVHFFLSAIQPEPVEFVMAGADTTTRTFRDGMQVETMAVTCVQMQSGTRLVMQTGDDTAVARGETVFRFYGAEGTLEWFLCDQTFTLRNAAHPAGATVAASATDPRRPHQRYLDSLAGQIKSGVCDYAVPDRSLTALEICEAACVSANHRCRVTFPYDAFTVPPDTGWLLGMPYSGSGGGRDGRKLG